MQELAFTLADGLGYVAGVRRARHGRRRLRAAALLLLGRPQRLLRGDRQVPRRPPHLGARRMQERFGAKDPRRWLLRTHAQTAGRLAHRAAALQQRGAHRAPGAGGGARAAPSRSTPTRSTRPTRCPPRRRSRIALRTQQIIALRVGRRPGGRSARPAATTSSTSPTRWRSGARDYIRRIDEMGGIIRAVEEGYPAEGDRRERLPLPARGRAAASGSSSGVNGFQAEEDAADPAAQDRRERGRSAQIERLQAVEGERERATGSHDDAGAAWRRPAAAART